MAKLLMLSTALTVVPLMAFAADAPGPTLDWTGMHVGAQIGISASELSTNSPIISGGEGRNPSYWRFTGDSTQTLTGINIGYNKQISNFVLGVEGDVDYKGGNGYFAPRNEMILSDWDASLRGKVGVLLTPSTLVYGTAGISATSFSTVAANNPNGEFFTSPNYGASRLGWTVGGGAEYAIDSQWSLKGEYRYTDYGTMAASGNGANMRLSDERIIAGLNYNFSGVPGERASTIPDFSWTGPYFGVHIGAAAATMDVSTDASIGDLGGPYSGKGQFFETLAGLDAGYDLQVGDRLVIGLAADINTKSGGGTFDLPGTKSRPQSDFDGSIRARVGVTLTPRSLAYVTGGFAFGNFTTPFHENEYIYNPVPGDVSEVLGGMRYGWTVGGGLQEQLDSNWSMGIEARYTDWGTKNINWDGDDGSPPGLSRLSDVRVTYAMAYKLGGSANFDDSDVVKANWQGLYAGLQLGSSSAHNQFDDGPTDAAEYNDFTTPMVGLTAGYNFLAGSRFILGVEGDLNYKFGHGFGIDDVLRYTSNWDGSIRGRAGFLVTPSAMVYGTGGYAVGNFTSPSTGADCCSNYDWTEEHLGGMRDGLTYGGGLEYALGTNVKADMQYRHTDWGTKLTNFNHGDVFLSHLSDNRVTLGLTYTFAE